MLSGEGKQGMFRAQVEAARWAGDHLCLPDEVGSQLEGGDRSTPLQRGPGQCPTMAPSASSWPRLFRNKTEVTGREGAIRHSGPSGSKRILMPVQGIWLGGGARGPDYPVDIAEIQR